MKHEETSFSEAPVIPERVLADLLRIGGTNDYGEPRLRVVWGGSHQWFRAGKWRLEYPIHRKLRRLVAWNAVNPITGEKRHIPVKHSEFSMSGPDKSLIVIPGAKVDEPVQPVLPGWIVAPVWENREVGYQGWVLQEWWPPEIVCQGWESARWLFRADGSKVDLLGEPPIRGQYRFLMYLDDGNEPPTPLEITDHRIIETIECAIQLRQDQGAADGWRTIQTPEKAKQMFALIQKDRDRTTQEEEEELTEFIADSVKTYARKFRHVYLT